MLSKTIINAISIIAVCVAGVSYLNSRSDQQIIDKVDAIAENQKQQDPRQRKRRSQSNSNINNSASVVSIPKDRRSGQFQTTGRVNSGYVNFLVDTGASTVALTLTDARKAGVDVSRLQYNVPVTTAGGTNYAAAVKLDSVALGGITLRNIDGLVFNEGLDISLLGMTWLGQLQEVRATPNALMLRL